MKITVDIQWLADRMRGVVEYHRLKMTYGSMAVRGGGMFSNRHIPIVDSSEYWNMMVAVSPWNKLNGVFTAIAYGDMSHSVQLDCDTYSMIVAATRE